MNLKINIQYINGVIKVYDVTGLYEEHDNPGGWGGENTERDAVSAATISVFHNDSPYRTINVTHVIKEGEGEDVLLTEVDVDKDGAYHVSYHATLPSGEVLYSIGKTAYCFDNVTEWTSRFWAHLARLNDSYQHREFAPHCVWLNTHIEALSSLAVLNKRREFLMLLHLIEKRIYVNKRYLSAPGSFTEAAL